MDQSGACEALGQEDEHFDAYYPAAIRALSNFYWTPVAVARAAANYLVDRPGTRVLDLGCGPGKFCIVGALSTAGHFTGVEQREALVLLARAALRSRRLGNANFLHANLTEIHFPAYEAFYLFNPFEENLLSSAGIDRSVELSQALYQQYIGYVAAQLAAVPRGTRVVTYHGSCEEIPAGFECQSVAFDGNLKFWVKTTDA